MQSHKVDAFLSCSFKKEDEDVVNFFRSIAEALDIHMVNVSNASTQLPPDKAADLIDNSSLLIAICTKRDKMDGGGYVMPQAVQDEMSIAFGKSVPILMFIENGVQAVGFKSNYGTYEGFDRDKLLESDFVANSVSAIHAAKLEALGDDGGIPNAGMDDAVAEYVNHLVELREDADDYYWSYSTQKKIVYTAVSKRSFPSGVWPTVKSNCVNSSRQATWRSELIDSSRDIKLIEKVEKHTQDCIEVALRADPHPEKGDHIEYATYATSRYINAIWSDELEEDVHVHLDNGDYECADGLIFIHRAKSAQIEFRFPNSYGIRKEEINPFVGSYTTRVDYLVPSELERADIKVEDFAGNITVRIAINSPLPGHIYGIAWHPKARPSVESKVDTPNPP